MRHNHGNSMVMFALAFLGLTGVAVASDGASASRVVAVPVVNMYSTSNDNSDVVSQAVMGSNVTLLKKKGKWLHVKTSDDYTGWVPKTALRENKGQPYASGAESVQVTSLFANIYRDTDVTTHAPIATLPFEGRLEVINEGDGKDSRWLQVRLPDGHTGWIQRGDVTSSPKILTIPESIELAKRFMGIPYLWGGRSSFGYDCSGFTQMLLRSRGITMPRDADLQAAWSGLAPIERKDLQAGDLLFFGESDRKITHTGMYIGSGEFIHDTTNNHPMVQISRLDDEPWTHLLVATRRVR
jgi:cell wall-associated NlpC family hydrolase